ncbi:hypothetical protein HZA41_02680 [Candidatus Peregrinibacteria bacterium]|nr:hypothetical protein [Candidatus Peregrinibacteria bacterium]
MLGKTHSKKYRERHYRTLDLDHVAVKAPQFSFSRLKGADPVLGVEMASTGEVACFGDDLPEAFLKAMISAGLRFPQKNILITIGRLEDKVDFVGSAKRLINMGFNLFATHGTSKILSENGIKNTSVYKPEGQGHPNVVDLLNNRTIDFVINVPKSFSSEEITQGYLMRRRAVDLNVPLMTNLQVAKLLVSALEKYRMEDLKVKEWKGYF